ncbi:MAG: response regulator transcription factor [Bacteroidales bacterium]|nr:response regulator transcription factor [Bacteroidales bacterium]MCF8403223.1 response regulator transcription factor [Bacteroidales bacterium]
MVVQDYLEMLEYKTTLCRDGEEGFNKFRKNKYDLIILDVMMPKMDGFSLAVEIRKYDTKTPIIFLTAKTLKDDRIKGFMVGCDDYISKPFSTEELSMRIKAILKRCQNNNGFQEPEDTEFEIGSFKFDHINMLLKQGETVHNLTRKETALLKLLCIYQDKLLSRETALKSIWGDDDYFIGRSMDVFISKLRKYLRSDPKIHITNIHGTGFKLEVIDEE